jgi:cAMP-dependent protein kinase regulator
MNNINNENSHVKVQGIIRKLNHNSKNVRKQRNMYERPPESSEDFRTPCYSHSPEDMDILNIALKSDFIFSSLHENELKPLIDAFEPCTFKAGDVIINQGDVGDYFYILKDGEVNCTVDGKIVKTISERGSSFGDLSLLFSSLRAASVIAINEINSLFRVDRKTFQYLLKLQTKKSSDEKISLLRGIPFLENLPTYAINKLANNMIPYKFEENEIIIKKGDVGEKFYILHIGKLLCKDISVGNTTFDDKELGPGDYFGYVLSSFLC